MSITISNVSVFTGRADQPVEVGTVVVTDGRIAYVGPAAGSPSAGGTTIDGTGRTLLPGLVDAHAHVMMDEDDRAVPRIHNAKGDVTTTLTGLWRAQRALRAGVTTLRDCMTTTQGIWALRASFRSGQFQGPNLVLSGRAVVPSMGHMHYVSNVANGADDVRRAIREELGSGADFIKICIDNYEMRDGVQFASMQMTPDEVRSAVETAHALGHPVTAHAVSPAGIARALDAGVDCIEHGEQLTPELAARMAQRGTWLVATLSVPDAAIKVVTRTPALDARMASMKEHSSKSLAIAVAAGVRIAAGSDAGSPGNHVWDFVPELELMHAAGMTTAAVLQAATSDACELAGIGATTGRVEAGYVADLLLVDGDPLADLDALRAVSAVIKGGTLVPLV